ncbi:DUF3124 domain-containing protein [Luteibaculum oceani]|uniref:DUF3124 domain-containing protein n=2 Tax=Luteibaculum oceani TaxID=1294296 RepID=A0A5C6V5N5_9FLAO|nr:DUF3124 domain-containing protein [Luteibaculum oceani]
MKITQIALVLGMLLFACSENKKSSSIDPVNWANRAIVIPDSTEHGATYLSIYSQIYSLTEHRKHDLTVTVSMRNTSTVDTLYIESAKYFDGKGKLIRNYFKDPIYISPLETVDIVIDEKDREGGTGANFLFSWSMEIEAAEPLFEAVMISTSGQQGLSFTTTGKRVN